MTVQRYQHFGIIGAGAWGTALAVALRRAGRDVTIWSHSAEGVDCINKRHENSLHLPGLALDPKIRATPDLADVGAAEVLLFATPAQRLRGIAKSLHATKVARKDAPIIITSKGIELGSTKLMSAIIEEEMPGHGIAVLSGPCFAIEVARGQPTALTFAIQDKALGDKLTKAIATPVFRPYLSDDIIGAQLGGALKNVMAIACGIVAGKALGENARAALITRGLAEIMRLGASLGARTETLMGLSGLGDLLLTCSSKQSRNMSLGFALGEGEPLENILSHRNSVAEGVPTAAAAMALARARKVEMPIVAEIASVIKGTTSIDQAIVDLMSRPLRSEGR